MPTIKVTCKTSGKEIEITIPEPSYVNGQPILMRQGFCSEKIRLIREEKLRFGQRCTCDEEIKKYF